MSQEDTKSRLEDVAEEFDYSWKTKDKAQIFWIDHYPKHYSLYRNLLVHRNERICCNAQGGRRLLDIGCGFGDLLYFLREQYDELYGVDPSVQMVQQTNDCLTSRSIANLVSVDQALAEDLPFDDAMFDTVLLIDTYEHVHREQREKALQEIRRVLVPEGEMILVTPSRRILYGFHIFDNCLCVVRRLLGRERVPFWTYPPQPAGITEYFPTKRELLNEISQAGFRVDTFEKVGFYPAPERPGFLKSYMSLIHRFPMIENSLLKSFQLIARCGVLNQKMLVRAKKR